MNRFAALLDALLFTPSRGGKLSLMREYFASTPDPERGWALAALTGELSFAEAKPRQVRDLAGALDGRGGQQLFISTCSVYKTPVAPGFTDRSSA